MVNCYICMDNGFVTYTKRENGCNYQYIAHCTCPKGNEWRYDGSKLEKNKSDYYIPHIDAILDTYELAKQNYRAIHKAEMGDSYEGGVKHVEVYPETVGAI